MEYDAHLLPDVRITIDVPYDLSHVPIENRCEKTSFYPALTFVVCTFVAQVVLTLRLENPFFSVTLSLFLRSLSQDVRRDKEERSNNRWVCDYYRLSAGAWDMGGSLCGERGR